MQFVNLHVERVRNLSEVTVDLGPGLNLFIGPNGAGKTAVLEAVHILARGRSFRTPKLGPVLQHGSTDLLVRADVYDARDRSGFSAGLIRRFRGGTELRVDGKPEKRLSTLARRLPIQLVLPDVSGLVFAGPSERRRFLNWGVFHVKHDYAAVWQQYSKALKQRNALLKASSSVPQPFEGSELHAWTERLCLAAGDVTRLQKDYFEHWQPYFVEALRALDSNLAVDMELFAGYDLPVALSNEIPADKVVGTDKTMLSEHDYLLNLLSENLSREVKYGATQLGPHRADLRLFTQDVPVNSTLSRGQGKTVALALLVSQARYLMEHSGRSSIFLIDDVGAELDSEHNQRFFGLLQDLDCQILATTTEAPMPGSQIPIRDMQLFHVEQGAISKLEQ